MTDLTPGLYEQLITRALEERLSAVLGGLAVARAKLPTEEAADRLALHLGRQLRPALTALDSRQRVALGVALAQRIIGLLEELNGSGIDAAIDRQRLCPFANYGISDGTDLSRLTWSRGRGCDVEELTNVLTRDDALARGTIHKVAETVPNAATKRPVLRRAGQRNECGVNSMGLSRLTPGQIGWTRGPNKSDLRIRRAPCQS